MCLASDLINELLNYVLLRLDVIDSYIKNKNKIVIIIIIIVVYFIFMYIFWVDVIFNSSCKHTITEQSQWNHYTIIHAKFVFNLREYCACSRDLVVT